MPLVGGSAVDLDNDGVIELHELKAFQAKKATREAARRARAEANGEPADPELPSVRLPTSRTDLQPGGDSNRKKGVRCFFPLPLF